MRLFISGVMAALAVAMAAEMVLVQPKDLAAELASKGARPVIFHVGPNFLYRGKHIPGSEYAGAASSAAGLAALRAAAAKLPRDGEVIVYCGCCPWDHCPNIKPAVDSLKMMGFTRVRALYLETNFAKDWTEKGYPVEAGTPRQ